MVERSKTPCQHSCNLFVSALAGLCLVRVGQAQYKSIRGCAGAVAIRSSMHQPGCAGFGRGDEEVGGVEGEGERGNCKPYLQCAGWLGPTVVVGLAQ